jgi:glycosyltransferase involved in cell wall biosynthesis
MTQSKGRSFWDADTVMTPAAASIHDAALIGNPYNDAPIDITIFVSCHNEAGEVIQTIDGICESAKEAGLSFEILVIDDVSTDNSRELVRDYIAAHPDERIVLRANRQNKGLAQNYLDAAFIGRGKYFRLVCGDSAEPKEGTVAVFKAIGKADCILPYFNTNRGRATGRRIISNAYTAVINAITGNNIRYYNGLAVHLRHNVMRWHTNTGGFGFQADILCLLLDRGFTYLEVPIEVPATAFTRQDTKSRAMSLPNVLSVTHTILEIASRRIAKFVYSKRR